MMHNDTVNRLINQQFSEGAKFASHMYPDFRTASELAAKLGELTWREEILQDIRARGDYVLYIPRTDLREFIGQPVHDVIVTEQKTVTALLRRIGFRASQILISISVRTEQGNAVASGQPVTAGMWLGVHFQVWGRPADMRRYRAAYALSGPKIGKSVNQIGR